jgi:hypothetical protein
VERQHSVRPGLSTPPTAPVAREPGHVTDGVCLFLDLLPLVVPAACETLIVPVVHALLLCIAGLLAMLSMDPKRRAAARALVQALRLGRRGGE